MKDPDPDLSACRPDFPILNRPVHGKPLIYFDNAATSQKPQCVIEAVQDYFVRYNANVHRAIHTLGEEATARYEAARDKVAAFLHAPQRESIVFTRGTTEGINLVAYSWGRAHLGAGDEILLTEMEHHSNLVPWQILAQEKGVRLRFVGFHEDGTLRLEDLDTLLTPRTKLVAVTHMSNVLGTVNPVAEIVSRAHALGALVLVDAAQSVPHLPLDVQALDCDFLAFSGHKMLGPTGSGALYGKRELLEAMPPFMGGGEMISQVGWDHSTWNELPYKFEAGTPSIGEAIGLGQAIDYLQQVGLERIHAHEGDLTAYALGRLQEFGPVQIYGSAPARGGVISFNLEKVHPHDLATLLDQEGIAIRAGHHCAQPLMKRLGVLATGRISFYLYNTRDEVEVFLEALQKASSFFG